MQTHMIETLRQLATGVFTDSTQLIGTVIVITLPLLYLYWRKSIHELIQKKLDVRVVRLHKGLIHAVHSGPLAPYMDVDEDIVAKAFPDMKMMSIVDYMGSLQPKGAFSLQSALISILDKSGIRVALPLALFAPASWQKQSDPLIAVFDKSPFAGLLLGNMISTLGLATISMTSHRQYVKAKRYRGQHDKKDDDSDTEEKKAVPPEKKQFTALGVMVHGSNPKNDGGLSTRIESPITIPDDVAVAAGVDAGDIGKDLPMPPAPDAKIVHPIVFPDLYMGNGGLQCVCSEPQAKVNELLAALLNKLASNMLIGLDASPAVPDEPYKVRLQNSPQEYYDNVEDFIAALEATDHTVTMKMYSAITSFSIGMSVKETSSDGKVEWIQLPLAFPVSTGLLARNEKNEPVEAITLMQHAGIVLSVSGPLFDSSVEWCLNIAGMTGFTPTRGVDFPWANLEGAKKCHAVDVLATPEGRRACLRYMSVSSTVLNLAADRGRLMFGGYGALGVCIDSVAGVQQALTGECTLFPLMLAGEAKTGLLGAYKAVKKRGLAKGGGSFEYAKEIDVLFEATKTLRCDAIVEPKDAAAVARRILACMPERTVFKGLERCRESIRHALRTAESIMD